MDSPTPVLAVKLAAAGGEPVGEERQRGAARPGNRGREIRVTGTAEVRCPADRAAVRVSVGNSKESVNEVSNSVTRRLDYILQSLR